MPEPAAVPARRWGDVVLASMSEGVVVQDITGTIVDCNPAAERLIGLARDVMTGRTSRDPRWAAIHEDGSPFPGSEHPPMVTLRTGRPCDGVVMGIRLPDGRDRWIRVASRPIWPDEEGRPRGVVSIFEEITELRRERAALASAAERLTWVAEHSNDVTWVADVGTRRLSYISPSVERQLGFTVEEALTHSIEESVTDTSIATILGWTERRRADRSEPGGTAAADGAGAEARVGTAVAGHLPPAGRGLVEARCRDGSTKLVETSFTTIADEHGRITALLGVSHDVTDRVREEREREATLAELREALAKVRTLSGLLPICVYCKRIRNDQGYWDRIEKYVAEHSEAQFSHGMCPDCYTRYAASDGATVPSPKRAP